MTYEGARGVTGDFLGHLGASGAIVGIVAGGGELAGYIVRIVSGVIADRTGQYWMEIWAGYLINLLCVPALALAQAWPSAAGLMIGERLGRGIRRPAMSSLLSRAGRELGSGKVFGINHALDSIGGALGPLIVALVLVRSESFHAGFGILLIPALAAFVCLSGAESASRGAAVRPDLTTSGSAFRFPRLFWIYAIGGALFAAGYADFALIAYHLGRAGIASPAAISALYALAMVLAALSAPALGFMLDRMGMVAIALAIAVGAAATPMVFLGSGMAAAFGVAIWEIATAIQDSLLVALVANVTPEQNRSTAYGVFDLFYGVAWMAGSAALGILYDHFAWGLVALSVGLQTAAIAIFWTSEKMTKA